MSMGVAFPSITSIAPSVDFAPPPPVAAQALPHTGVVHPGDVAGHLHAHGADLAGQAAHHAADAAAQVLGSLSGVLLAGRAALLTTRVLAAAAVRAADEQRCLERQQRVAATAAEQWEAAAFAAVSCNARRRVLRARVARAGRAPHGPAGPPPVPDLPPPLEPVGARLCDARQQLAGAEERLRAAEERHAAWEQRRTAALLRLDDGGGADDDWRRGLRDARRRALERLAAERGAEDGRAEAPEGAGGPLPGSFGPGEVGRLGAEILGGLDPYAATATAELAQAAVGHAVRRAADEPSRARNHLVEARKFVRDANREARETRAAQERAARELDFLEYETGEGVADLPVAPDALALLRRTLDDGAPLTRAERDLVARRVEERRDALEAVYLTQQCAGAVAELARRFGGPAGAQWPEGQEIRLDWVPDGWEPGHWLRATVVGGVLRVATMYQDTAGERTPGQRALDDTRCAQTRRHLADFEEITGAAGLGLAFRVERAEGALPGVLGEDAVLLDGLLDDALGADARRQAATRDARGYRTRTADGGAGS
ncbi:hypothetical protein [Streptomyces sp. NPDC050560]|uniref:hypothetical protein n=1 Tax=Streptomyces sp. NPDC050560 TaxID=3365630 RepID=UPI0037A7DF9E